MRGGTEEQSIEVCPLCTEEVCTSTIQRHVNAHLDAEVEAGDKELAAKLELESCEDDHFVDLQRIGDASKAAGRFDESGDRVTCKLGCKQVVPLSEWESHMIMHQLEAEEIAAEMDRQEQEKPSELAARDAQHGFFAPLQLQHGVSNGESSQGGGDAWRHVSPHAGVTVRGGAETGGGSGETQDPPVAEQRETIRRRAPEGIVELLRQALEADCKGICRAALSGYVDHYESRRRDDLGWGCGWRNIQMLCSNLVEDPEISGAIFGGGATVPEIPELQKWLEQAWKEGFDVMGADQLGWNVRETQKWIGTTECAALLRSFGLRARIADFRASNVRNKREPAGGDSQAGGRGQSAKRPRMDGAARTEMSGGNQGADHSDHAVHVGVQCDHCEMNPIRGARYKSTVKDNFDLCEQCKEAAEEQEASRGVSRLHLYLKMDTPHVRDDRHEGAQKGGGAGSGARTESANAHMRLIEWVWKYFTTGAGAAEPSGADEAPASQRRHVIMSNRPPLYFQHEGHSRTIVGIERRRSRPDASEEAFLLILDPSQRTAEIVEALRQKKGWQRLIKRGVHTLRKPEYQLCFVEPGIAKGEELEKLKVLDSVLHQY